MLALRHVNALLHALWWADLSQSASCVGCRFAHMIGTREHASHLWRVTKDPDQHSHIEKEPI